MLRQTIIKLLVLSDITLFLTVMLLLLTGGLDSDLGVAVLLIWVVVFMSTMAVFTATLSQGVGWYNYGMIFTGGMLLAVVAGIILGLDFHGIAFLIPFGVMCMLAVSWMFLDTSEDEVMKDLQKLSRKIK